MFIIKKLDQQAANQLTADDLKLSLSYESGGQKFITFGRRHFLIHTFQYRKLRLVNRSGFFAQYLTPAYINRFKVV